jgi:hypothetical protein
MFDVVRWPFPADVSINHLSSSCCCRSTPLSWSSIPSCLLQRQSGLYAARTIEHLMCSSSGSSHEVLSKNAPLSTNRCVPLTVPKSCCRGCQPLHVVPFLPFLTTSTVSSADDLVGLLHPTTDYRVRLVSCRLRTFPP